uniref:CARD domain-containing protein n=1 Tax=Echeneis naucrates TaxID=173247 RepID=A0A665TT23_ECHNA
PSGLGFTSCSNPDFSSLPADEHFVDKYQIELINRVSNVDEILDELLQKKVIIRQKYAFIRSQKTSYDKMRELFPCLEAGEDCKDIFYEILTRLEKYLISDLQKKK